MRHEWIENVTHDMMTPLSPIKGYAELIADGQCEAQADVRSSGEIILRNAERIDRLVSDLKLTYQLDGGKLPLVLSRMPLARAAKECVIEIVNADVRAAEAVSFSSSTQAVVELDRALFARALGNIIANAMAHNPVGTSVAVNVYEAGAGLVAVSVRDDGGGIPEEELPRLFDRYWRGSQLNDAHDGSGLGLAIAKEAIEAMGGAVSAESLEGEGATFILEFPACGEA